MHTCQGTSKQPYSKKQTVTGDRVQAFDGVEMTVDIVSRRRTTARTTVGQVNVAGECKINGQVKL